MSFLDALGGNITADEWLAMQQQGQQQEVPADPRQQYLGLAMSQMGQIPGYAGNVKPGYMWDDALAGAKFAYGMDQDTLDRQAKEQSTQFTQGIQQNQENRAQQKFSSEFSDPQSDLAFLVQQGIPPEQIANIFQPGNPNFAKDLDTIAPLLPGLVDDTGNPSWHTVPGQQRIMALANAAQSQVQQAAPDQGNEPDMMNRQRWQLLNPQERAHEMLLRRQDPFSNAVVNPGGKVFTGDNSERQAWMAWHPDMGPLEAATQKAIADEKARKAAIPTHGQRVVEAATKSMINPLASKLARLPGVGGIFYSAPALSKWWGEKEKPKGSTGQAPSATLKK